MNRPTNWRHHITLKRIGVGAQSTLGGTKFLPEKICIKNQQNARILHDFCPKNDRILRNNCPKNIFARILEGHVPPPCPPSPTPTVCVFFAEKNSMMRRPLTDDSVNILDITSASLTTPLMMTPLPQA